MHWKHFLRYPGSQSTVRSFEIHSNRLLKVRRQFLHTKIFEDLPTENVATVLIFLLAMSVSTSTLERRFHTMARVKTYVRSVRFWENGLSRALVYTNQTYIEPLSTSPLTALLTLRDIHLFYKKIQKGLSRLAVPPRCSLSQYTL